MRDLLRLWVPSEPTPWLVNELLFLLQNYNLSWSSSHALRLLFHIHRWSNTFFFLLILVAPLPGQKAPSSQTFEQPKAQGWSPFGFIQNAGKGAAPKRKDKENQDGTLIAPNLYDGVNVFCVFDGHGENGTPARLVLFSWHKVILMSLMSLRRSHHFPVVREKHACIPYSGPFPQL
jgi:hypothetical protein